MTAQLPRLSVLFFASHHEADAQRYRLFHEAARICDSSGFEAIWLPERHFNEFGGLYPNPSVLGAALAMTTRNVRIRAGSIVAPLQDPLRVAEEWAVVDNLSGGRVDLAFAQGWNPADFVLAPQNYPNRLELTFERMAQVRALWRGEAIPRTDGNGNEVMTHALPAPVQDDIAMWLTCVGSEERFRAAGAHGYNVLTALLMQGPEDLQRNLAAYRDARAEAGLDPNGGRVTLMLHTLVHEDEATLVSKVRPPLINYLRESFALWKQRFDELESLDSDNRDLLWEFAFQRYFRTSGLFGTPERAQEILRTFAGVGVDEVACLLDYGVDTDTVCHSLSLLGQLGEPCHAISAS